MEAQDLARKVGDERVHMERNGGWVGHPVTGGQARWVDGAEANTAPTTIRPGCTANRGPDGASLGFAALASYGLQAARTPCM